MKEWWRKTRAQVGLTQEELADKLKITQAALSAIEVGRVLPRPRHVGALLDLVKASDTERLAAWAVLVQTDRARSQPETATDGAQSQPETA